MSFQWTARPGFPGVPLLIRTRRQSTLALLCTLLLSAPLASCGPIQSPFDRDTNTPEAAATAEDAVIEPLIGPPPGSGERPPRPGEIGTVFTPDGLPALPPRGVNVEELFAANIRDTDKRFDRLENAVTEIRREFNAVMPAIVRLVAIEEDIQDLVQQLQLLLQDEPPSQQPVVSAEAGRVAAPPPSGTERPVPLTPYARAAEEPPAASPPPPTGPPPTVPPPEPPSAPVPAPLAEPVPVAPAQPQQTPRTQERAAAPRAGVPAVKAVRFGEHSDKTRLVLDVSSEAVYRYDLDNMENLLVIELPGTAWAARESWSSETAPLIASYSVQPMDGGGDGSRVILLLKHDAEIVKETTIPADGYGDYRIVLDIMSPNIHR